MNVPARTGPPNPIQRTSLFGSPNTKFGPANSDPEAAEGGSGTNFDKIVGTETAYDGISVSLYKSRETGLKVLIADVETPIVLSSRFRLESNADSFR